MQQFNSSYTLGFAAAICFVCSLAVSFSAVSLKDKQVANQVLDRKKNVLMAAGISAEELTSPAKVEEKFKQFKAKVVDLRTGEYTDAVDANTYDQKKATKDPSMSRDAGDNPAKLSRMPYYVVVYQVLNDQGEAEKLVLPIEGKGLWSTLYGFLALDIDTRTIQGITYYQHGETPGLGGEVDNPGWKAKWPGRLAYDENWELKIKVIKGPAGSVQDDPYHVDGLSGATITSNGVSNMLKFWLGDSGYGPYLEKIRKSRGA